MRLRADKRLGGVFVFILSKRPSTLKRVFDVSKLDFSTVINRRGTDSYKWDAADRVVGNTETIQMGCADMDFKSPPEIIEELHKVVEHGIFGYATLTQQYAPGIVSWYKERHNCELKADWILYVPRIVVACSVLVNTFTQKGDKVILNSPYYPPLNDVTSGCYREVICPALVEKDGRYVMDLEALEKQIDASTKLMILVSPHNPTTRIWTREELQAIAYFCVKHDLMLFVDEIHSDFAAKGQTFISMADIKGPIQDRLVVVNAPAKTFNVMGCAMSYLIVPNEDLRKRLEKALDAAGETDANDFGNAVMRVAYQKCGYYVDEVNAYIDDNDAYLRDELPKLFPQVVVKPREGTYLLWVDFTKVFPNEEVLHDFFTNKAKVNVLMGSHFGPNFDGFVRINMGCPRATLEEVMRL